MIRIDRRTPFLVLVAVLAAASAACGTARNNADGAACQQCHGGVAGNAAPPLSTTGETAATSLAVGAHQAHLGRTTFGDAVQCGECHEVPGDAASHLDGTARVVFSGRAVARQDPPQATWDRATGTCSNVACHGGNLAVRGPFAQPVWNAAGQAHLDCGSCHPYPPANHLGATNCSRCHERTVSATGGIIPGSDTHMNGSIQFADEARCNGCHGAPPDTGAHRAHVAGTVPPAPLYGEEWRTEEVDPGGLGGGYSFGCGACHPKDVAKHRDGVVEVELTVGDADQGGLRSLNQPTAAFAGGRCSGVYCHSSGQAAPAFKTTPAWTSGETLGCDGCHGNPPSYPNGGPDGVANSHIFLNFLGREAGHFAGLPGPTYHKSQHGQPAAYPTPQQAAPITCQTCHADTVDPAHVFAGGVFYADTSITTQLPGGSAARFTDPAWKDTQCVTCHGVGGGPATVSGAVRPLRHVNGARDVVFDQRTRLDLPGDWLSGLGASAPTRPYFMTGATFYSTYTLPADAGWDMPSPPPARGERATLSFQLGSAGWEPTTRTCSSVACHLGNAVRWGQQDFETVPATCTGCHDVK